MIPPKAKDDFLLKKKSPFPIAANMNNIIKVCLYVFVALRNVLRPRSYDLPTPVGAPSLTQDEWVSRVLVRGFGRILSY